MAKATENMKREARIVDFILVKTICRIFLLVFEGGCHARTWETPSFYIAQYHALPACLLLPLGLKSHRADGSEEALW
jgi:hypothetical protein